MSGEFQADDNYDGNNDNVPDHVRRAIVLVAGVNAADWASKVGPTVQSAILSDRELNYVIPIYDGMVQFVMPAIITTGTRS